MTMPYIDMKINIKTKERKFHTEVIEIFQRQCVDKMILKEKRMINYVTVMGIKSVLDNGISNYEIYKQVRYEIINHIGNDLKRLENHFRNVIEEIIQIIKIKPWPYQEFMDHVFKINDSRNNFVEKCYFNNDHELFLQITKRVENLPISSKPSNPSKVLSTILTSPVMNDDDSNQDCEEENLDSKDIYERLNFSKVAVEEISSNSKSTTTNNEHPIVVTTTSKPKIIDPIKSTTIKPKISRPNFKSVTMKLKITTTSKPITTRKPKMVKSTTLKPIMMTEKPKMVKSTTSKPILKTKPIIQNLDKKKSRICNGRKVFRTIGIKRDIVDDQNDDYTLNDEEEINQIMGFLKEFRELNQQYDEKVLEKLNMMIKIISENQEKSRFKILDMIQMLGTIITGIIVSIQLFYIIIKLNMIKKDWYEYVQHRKLEMSNIEAKIEVPLVKIDEEILEPNENETKMISTNPFESKSYHMHTLPFFFFSLLFISDLISDNEWGDVITKHLSTPIYFICHI